MVVIDLQRKYLPRARRALWFLVEGLYLYRKIPTVVHRYGSIANKSKDAAQSLKDLQPKGKLKNKPLNSSVCVRNGDTTMYGTKKMDQVPSALLVVYTHGFMVEMHSTAGSQR